MEVLIRTDSSRFIGIGHLMRCLTLADALKKEGAVIHFVCRDLTGNLSDLVKKSGHHLHVLPGPEEKSFLLESEDDSHRNLHPVPWITDLQETKEIACSITRKFDWIIVDSYSLDANWENGLRDITEKIMVIDDLADRNHDCDLLLDQNYYHSMKKRYSRLVPDDCALLLGPQYALLRPEFKNIRKNLDTHRGSVTYLLICFGGSGLNSETVNILKALKRVNNNDLVVDVVISKTDSHGKEIVDLCSKLPDCTCHFQTNNMAELMNKADLMFGGCGTTTWERCCIGLPAVVTGIAENQLKIAEDLAEDGVIYYLGQSSETSISSYKHALMAMLNSPWLVKLLSKNSLSLVDGQGCKRVVSSLMIPEIKLRPALMDDLENIFNWRNAPETRKYSLDSREITMSEHKNWFINRLSDANSILLVGQEKKNGKFAGVIRYDLCEDTALVSVYLVPDQHGRGIGSYLLKEGSCWLKQHSPHIVRIEAEIMDNNKASVKAFKKADFQLYSSKYYLNISES